MSLPELREVPEGFTDDQVVTFICESFERAKSSDTGSSIEFSDALAWLLKIIITRAEDKAAVLFRCGLIFLNPFVAVNAATLANTMAYPSADPVTRQIKQWSQASWDADDRAKLLAMYDNTADVKAWAVRIPPQDSVVFRVSVFRPMEQIQQRVPEMEEVPGVPVRPPMQVNVERVGSHQFQRKEVANVPPFVWVFDTEAAVKMDFVD